jgi:hypothetical protein
MEQFMMICDTRNTFGKNTEIFLRERVILIT